MLQITPQMRILVAVEAVDFRKGIDSLAELCRARLGSTPLLIWVSGFPEGVGAHYCTLPASAAHRLQTSSSSQLRAPSLPVGITLVLIVHSLFYSYEDALAI